MTHTPDPYENLANAIILQAVKDYRAALKNHLKRPTSEHGRQDVEELEMFFRSGWYQMLTDVDGEYLIERLREEAENE